MIEIPEFSNKIMLFDFLQKNKKTLLNQKKSQIKECDKISFINHQDNDRSYSNKAELAVGSDPTKLFVSSVINTSNIIDSHKDLHIPGLWKKSLSENFEKYLVEEHKFNFRGIISDEVTAYTKMMSFKKLGFDYEGSAEALIYDSIIDKSRNEYMFEQYAKRRVKNHSVGMRYVKVFMCIDSPMYEEAHEMWDKYAPYCANVGALEEGFFWAVTEAKDVEGSAVVRGSNFVTPTLSIREQKNEPLTSTHEIEPSKDTQKAEALQKLLTKFKTLNSN